jgi:hypothetical protein
VALFGGEFEEADALGFVGAGAGHAENPADWRRLEAEHVVLDANGEVGVVEGGIEGEGLFGVLAGELAEFVGAVLVAIDERGPVGLHAGGDRLAVVSVGVFGIALDSGVGETFGLGDAVVEALLKDWVDGWALSGFEAVVVGEELDVENAEAIEFGENVGGGIGCGAEAVFGMGGRPLLEVGVGRGEIEVVEGVVAVVGVPVRGAAANRDEPRKRRRNNPEKRDAAKVGQAEACGGSEDGDKAITLFFLPHR